MFSREKRKISTFLPKFAQNCYQAGAKQGIMDISLSRSDAHARGSSGDRVARADQDLRLYRRQQGHRPDRVQWRDTGAAGRKRLRQDHADEHALRHLPAGRGAYPRERQGSAYPLPARRHRPGHRHDPSALQARGRAFRAGQHRAGHHGPLRQPQTARPRDRRSVRPLWPAHRPRAQDLLPLRQREADRGDPQGALPRRAHAGAGRAHRGAYPAGD